jgi:hypothetical protein
MAASLRRNDLGELQLDAAHRFRALCVSLTASARLKAMPGHKTPCWFLEEQPFMAAVLQRVRSTSGGGARGGQSAVSWFSRHGSYELRVLGLLRSRRRSNFSR